MVFDKPRKPPVRSPAAGHPASLFFILALMPGQMHRSPRGPAQAPGVSDSFFPSFAFLCVSVTLW